MKILVAIFVLTVSSVQAHNNLFFPGDAYFSAAFTKDLIAKIGKNDGFVIPYHRYSKSFMACGYAGLSNAGISKLPEATQQNLKETLEQLFKEEADKARTRETDKGKLKYFPVLIYNKDFNFKKFPVGLKFNENFKSEQIEKAKRAHAVDDRVESKELRQFDDKYAKVVRALDVQKIPKDLTAFMGVNEPIKIDGSKILFVVLLGGTQADLSGHAAQKTGLEIVVIGESVSRIKYK